VVSIADHQVLRVLEGRYVLERLVPGHEVAPGGDVLALVWALVVERACDATMRGPTDLHAASHTRLSA